MADDEGARVKRARGSTGGGAAEPDAPSTSARGPRPGGKYSEGGNTHDLMPMYYGRLFPTLEMYR